MKKITATPVVEKNDKFPQKVRYSDEDLEFFHGIIVDKMAAAKIEFRQLTGLEYDDGPKDLGEQALDGESRDFNHRLAERQKKFIRDLGNALVRIEQKSYGICRKTGKLIPRERLIVVPHATLCVEEK
jgi:RNA polymerase-binding transcription factor DksA